MGGHEGSNGGTKGKRHRPDRRESIDTPCHQAPAQHRSGQGRGLLRGRKRKADRQEKRPDHRNDEQCPDSKTWAAAERKRHKKRRHEESVEE